MKDVYLLKIPKESEKTEAFEKSHINCLPEKVKEKILCTRDKNTRAERTYMYALLRKILIGCGICEKTLLENFSFDEKGKPNLVNDGFYFSLSRTYGIAAVVISKESPVGIDVEKIDTSKKEKVLKLISRFCFDAYKLVVDENPKIELFADKNGEIIKNDCLRLKKASSDNIDYLQWTAMESILKCDGRGFEAVKKVSDVSDKMITESIVFSLDGNCYALSVSNVKQT